jgi:RHS repeat-associated protein
MSIHHPPMVVDRFPRLAGAVLTIASLALGVLLAHPSMAEDVLKLEKMSVVGNRAQALAQAQFGKMRDEQMQDALGASGGSGGSGGRAPAPPATNDRAVDKKDCEESDNPVVLSSGNKVLDEHDFATAPGDFAVGRTYSSNGGFFVGFGPNWSWSLGYQLKFETNPAWTPVCQPGTYEPGMPCPLVPGKFLKVTAVRPDGHRYDYTWNAAAQRYEDSRPVSTSWVVEELWSGSSPLSAITLWRDDGGRERYKENGQVLQVRDVREVGYTFNYTNLGNTLTTIQHTSGRSLTLAWSGGRISSITAPNGKIWSYGYNNGRLVSVTAPDALGMKTYHYENGAQPEALTGYSIAGVRRTEYAYYADGRVQYSGLAGGIERDNFSYGTNYTDLTNAQGHTTRYNFTTLNGIKRLTGVDRAQSTACPAAAVVIDYDSRGYVTRREDFAGNQSFYTYNDRGQLLEERTGVAPNGATTHQQRTVYQWDVPRNLVTKASRYGSSGSLQAETVYTWYPDSDSQRKRLLHRVEDCAPSCTSGQKRTTTWTYTFHANKLINQMTVDGPLAGTADSTVQQFSNQGNLLSVTNALSQATSFSQHNGLGQPGRMIDANGLSTWYTYDSKGRLTQTRVAATGGDRIWGQAWRPDDQLHSATDPTGRTTSLFYDSVGRLDRIDAPSATGTGTDRINLTYDLLSNVTNRTVTHWISGWSATIAQRDRFEYDTAGFLRRSYGNDGQQLVYTYDPNGQVAQTVDALSRMTVYEYDTHGRLKKITDPASGVTELGYDVLGRLGSVKDPRNKVTSYTFNGFGDLLTLQSPDTGTTTYQYDAAGRRWKTSPADGRTSEVTFDLLDRPTEVRAWNPGQGAWQYAYYGYDTCTNGQGRFCSVTNPGAAVSYAYTLTGELASESTVIEGQGYSVQHGYDVHGRRTLTAYPGGVEVSYGYDTASRVNNVQAKVGGTWRNVATGVTYDAAGRMTALTHGNGIGRSVSYDWDGRVTAIAGSLSPQGLGYAWTIVDLIETITNHAYPSLSQTFDYDGLSRLTGVTSTSGNHVISYDANGNRTTHTWGGALDTYNVASSNNRLNSVSATGTRARSYTHDAAGHRTAETIAGNTITHVYDGFARPASRSQPAMSVQQSHGATVSLPAGTWSYGHDGMGRRTFKRAPGNVLSRYLHGTEGGLVGETSPGGTTLTSIYLWLNGQPIGLVRGGQVYHVHADHLGRPEMLTNTSKAIVWRAENLAFDRKVVTASIGAYNLGFPGQYYDAEGASWQNWFRTYDGSIGRYTQSDPIGLAGGLNTYMYATGNPLSFVDESGLSPAVIALWLGRCAFGFGAGYLSGDALHEAQRAYEEAQLRRSTCDNDSESTLGASNPQGTRVFERFADRASAYSDVLVPTAVSAASAIAGARGLGNSGCAALGISVGLAFGDGSSARWLDRGMRDGP